MLIFVYSESLSTPGKSPYSLGDTSSLLSQVVLLGQLITKKYI